MAFRTKNFVAGAALALGLPFALWAEEHVKGDTVVATVNGTEITLGHMIVLKGRLPQEYQQLPDDVLFDGILDQLVQQTLLGEAVEQVSTGTQLTMDNEIRALRANEEISRVATAALTDEAYQAAYERAYGASEPEREYNASHILVRTEEEAMALVTELEAGADFVELAKEKSEGPSGPRGGSLGWFGKGAMVAPFEQAVLAMEVGAISAPVQTQFGWHVIKLNETRIGNAPALDDVKAELAETLQREAIEARIDALESEAEITRMTKDEIDPALLNDTGLLGD
ncbi:MAG: peptidylprolyl isomerase [Silicimonas sp.]|nr:peptidylprolyl isomerase [Silicimonas sp.]